MFSDTQGISGLRVTLELENLSNKTTLGAWLGLGVQSRWETPGDPLVENWSKNIPELAVEQRISKQIAQEDLQIYIVLLKRAKTSRPSKISWSYFLLKLLAN